MKRLFISVLLVSLLYVPSFAGIHFSMDGKDIILTADSDCEIEQFIQATRQIEKDVQTQKDILEVPTAQADSLSVNKDDKSLSNQKSFIGKNKIVSDIPFISPAAFARVSDKSITNADLPDEFDEMKLDMIRDIKAVNWKTGYNISARDLTFWDRLAFVCGRITSSVQIPSVATIGIPESLISDEEVRALADSSVQKLTKVLEYSIMDSKLKKEVRYTPEGLYFTIITKNPFLLLTIDDDIYTVLEETEMKILTQYGRTEDDRLLGTLFQNMAMFFDLRAKFQNINPKLRQETDELLKMSKYGAGDAWSTYKLLADHTILMNTLLQQHILTDDYEENTFVSLKKLFMQIGDDVKKHHAQESSIRKDPLNAGMVKHVDNEYKHIQNPKEDALKELENLSDTDKEFILRAYKKD